MQSVSQLLLSTESLWVDADISDTSTLGHTIAGCIDRDVYVHEHLYLEGEMQTHIYLVTAGVIGTYKLLSDGRRQVCTFAYPGQILGIECADKHMNHAEALCHSAVRSIPSNAIDRLIMDEPGFGQTLFRITAMELASTNELLVSLGRKTAAEKLATFLLNIARRNASASQHDVQIELPMKRCDIADYLGLTVETVSRHFTKLKLSGVIRLLSSNRICIDDMHLLDALAKGDTPTKFHLCSATVES